MMQQRCHIVAVSISSTPDACSGQNHDPSDETVVEEGGKKLAKRSLFKFLTCVEIMRRDSVVQFRSLGRLSRALLDVPEMSGMSLTQASEHFRDVR